MPTNFKRVQTFDGFDLSIKQPLQRSVQEGVIEKICHHTNKSMDSELAVRDLEYQIIVASRIDGSEVITRSLSSALHQADLEEPVDETQMAEIFRFTCIQELSFFPSRCFNGKSIAVPEHNRC